MSATQAVTCQNNLPASNPDSIYATNNADGTVTDTLRGLMWKKTVEASVMTWVQALAAAEASNFASYTDWRLPNLKELRSLVEECRVYPSINDTVFPGTTNSGFWSGSPIANFPNMAWWVGFDGGGVGSASRTNSFYVRLVRDVGASLVDVTSPILSAVSATTTTLTATSNEAATGYWIVVARGATAPTAAQVKAHVTYAGVTIVASGAGAMVANAASSFPVAGLSASTLYDFYLVAEDAAGNVSLVAKAQNSEIPRITLTSTPLNSGSTAASTAAHGDGHLGDRMSSSPLTSQTLILSCSSTACPWTATVQYDPLPFTTIAWITLGATSGTSTGVTGMTTGSYLNFSVAPWEGVAETRGATITVNDGTGIPKTWRVVQNPLTDWDEDGVADEWEQRGYPNANGTREALNGSYVNGSQVWVEQSVSPYGRIVPGTVAPSTAAEKLAAKSYRDIWLWIDEMAALSDDVQLKASAIRIMQASFLRQNIVVRVRRAVRDFGNLPNASPLLSHTSDCDSEADRLAVSAGIEALKNHSLKRSTSSTPTVDSAWRKKVWRHAVWGDRFSSREKANTTSDCANSVLRASGVAPGFGYFNLVYGAPGDWVIDRTAQSGTLMHELGHTLGLSHGGPISTDGGKTWIVDAEQPTADFATGTTTQINGYYRHRSYKPAHISVMNYAYQTGGIVTSDPALVVDYDGLPIINSNPLNEARLGAFWDNPFGSLYGATFACLRDNKINYQIDPAIKLQQKTFEDLKRVFGPGEKFDCGKRLGFRLLPSTADLDMSGSSDQVTKLTEWDRLVFATPMTFLDFLGIRGVSATSVSAFGVGLKEPDPRTLISAKDYRVSIASLTRNVAMRPSGMRSVVFKVVNSGMKPDTYTFRIDIPSFVTSTSLLPSLLLNPGESRYLTVDVVADNLVAIGTYGEIGLKVTSIATAISSDETNFDLTIVNNVNEVTPPTVMPSQETSPQDFTFADFVNAIPDAYVESATVTLIGLNVPVPVQVRDGEMSVNGGPWSNSITKIAAGDTLRVRTVSSSIGGDRRTVEVVVAGLVRAFNVTTKLTCNLDINGDSTVATTNDAVLIERYLMGFRGDALTAGLTLTGARSTSDLIAAFLGTGATLEVFGRTPPVATLDGLVLVRLMQGVGDDALLNGVAIPANALFTTAPAIRAYVNSKCGTSYASP